MLKFLSETEIGPEYLKLKGKDKRFAVAFWGKGALASLGLDGQRAKGTKIICNLESGATNPDVVKQLIRLGADVKSNPKLHAKVYASGSTVILGSSNASANGLVVEGDNELKGWIEANIMTDDPKLVDKVGKWFNHLWECQQSRLVNDVMLEEARKKWNQRRKLAPVKREGKGLLDICRKNQELFGNIFLAVYFEKLSQLAGDTIKEINQGVREVTGLSTTDFGRVWGYGDGWEFPDGAWFIDIFARNNPIIYGVARVFTPSLKVNIQDEGDLILAHRERGIQVQGINKTILMSQADKDFILEGVPSLIAEFDYGLISLVEAINYLDG